MFNVPEGLLNYQANTQGRLELSRDNQIKYYIAKLEINHDNAAGATFKSEGFARLISSIQIVKDGDKTIKQVDATKFVLDGLFEGGRKMHNDIKTNTASGLVSTVWFKIPMILSDRMVRPYDTMFNAKLCRSLNLLINWGSASSIGTGITVHSAKIDIFSNQEVYWARRKGEQSQIWIETSLSKDITSTDTKFNIELAVNKLYMGLLLKVEVDDARSNDVLKNIILKSGQTVHMNTAATKVQVENAHLYGITDMTDLTGLYYLDFCTNKKLSSVLSTKAGAFNTLHLEMDVLKVVGTNKVTVYYDEIEYLNLIENP